MLIQLLILLIIVGGALAILNVIPIDAGVKEFLPVAGLG